MKASYNGGYRTQTTMPVLLTLIFGLFAVGVNAGQVTVTSLPYSAYGDYDTLTISGTRLTSATNGITVSADHVVINLGSDTLEFGTDNGDSYYGLRIISGSYHVKVLGGTILHRGSGNRNVCLKLSRVNDILIQDVDMIVSGTNGQCFLTPSVGSPGNYNVEIDGGNFWSNCTGYTSRCQYDGCAIMSSMACYGGFGDYHIKIHNIALHTSPGQGIMVCGRSQTTNAVKALIYNNTITCDARNDTYTSYSGTCQSAANPYSIALLKAAPGSEVFGNTVVSGTTYGGSRGILIENCIGAADDYIKVYNNYVDVHEGPNVEYGSGLAVHGLRVRAIDGNEINYVHIFDNQFICTGDNLPETQDYNDAVSTLRYSDEVTTTSIIIERNLFRAKANSPGVLSLAVSFDYTESGGLVFRNNRVEGDGTLMMFGYGNGSGANVTLEGDTLAFLSPTYDGETYHLGYLGLNFSCTNNKACDITYENGTSDTDINYANAGTLNLALQRSLPVYVEGRNGLPVAGAVVTVENNYDNTVLSGTTNGYGRLEGAVTYRFESRTQGDSTGYNDFTVKVRKYNDSTVVTRSISATSSLPTVTLNNTDGSGDPPPEDTYAPGAIDDLSAVTGDDMGEVDLDWTAPGDDGYEGIVTGYEIRYSRNPISVATFAQASLVSDPPNPLPAGSYQSKVVGGLQPGEEYFFAVIAYDEAENYSNMSNVATAVSQLDLGTGDDDDTTTVIDSSFAVHPVSPVGNAVLTTLQPYLQVANVTPDEGNVYYFEVAQDDGFLSLIASSGAVAQMTGGITQWQVTDPLDPGQYYWHARANDSSFCDAVSFTIQPQPHVYPNPFDVKIHDYATITALPENSTLVITTVSGMLVRRWVDTSGEVYWNGNNESGSPVSSGVYLWNVEDSDSRGKIVLRR